MVKIIKRNALKELGKYGQSVWLDYIRRSLLTSGELNKLIKEDDLKGVTSNPTIFQKAIAGSTDYDDLIRKSIEKNFHLDLQDLFEELAINDIKKAAEILEPVYKKTNGEDGFVSFELAPDLSHDIKGSISEARRLWKLINKPNLMIKVPATDEGISIIETLISEEINVNVTLMFSLSQYIRVANAYLRGLDLCSNPNNVKSVASFFISRIDKVVDNALAEIGTKKALRLKGKIAVANAKVVYKKFKEIFGSKRWKQIEDRGGNVQRVLWASTSTKNPVYSDVLYVEELIGKHTINTMPPVTYYAFKDHGKAVSTLEKNYEKAEESLKKLDNLGLDLDSITGKLLINGVEAFQQSYNTLLEALNKKRQEIIENQFDIQDVKIGEYTSKVNERLDYWKKNNFLKRIWMKDYSLWASKEIPEITNRLDWLFLPELMHEQLEDFIAYAEKIRNEGIRHIVLLGMGGSSLAPEVYQSVFGNKENYPELIVLDSTHPSMIINIEKKIELNKTHFLVSSKSGTTTETLSLFKYFWNKISEFETNKGEYFTAITDLGTPLNKLAIERDFRHIFISNPNVGGRYSALTPFGLVPAALIGMDIHKFLDNSWIMSENCAFCVTSDEAKGLVLAAAMGELAKLGRDKITFLSSKSISQFPVWLEQLIAESLGKDKKGIIPIVNEPRTAIKNYGKDRFFVYISLKDEKIKDLDVFIQDLESSGYPTIKINLKDKINLGQEIFRWEIAVAAAGSILGVHPFNQPNVQMAKDIAKKMMKKAESGELPDENLEVLSFKDKNKLMRDFKSFLNQAKKNNYLAIQAYLPSNPDVNKILNEFRLALLMKFKLATTVGFGPRFLHSTGQLHKGGPNSGLFIQLIDEPKIRLNVPETKYSFNTLIKAQALGDYKALKNLGHRVIQVNLRRSIIENLKTLVRLVENEVF